MVSRLSPRYSCFPPRPPPLPPEKEIRVFPFHRRVLPFPLKVHWSLFFLPSSQARMAKLHAEDRVLSKTTSGDIDHCIEGIRSTWSILYEYHDKEDCVHAYTDDPFDQDEGCHLAAAENALRSAIPSGANIYAESDSPFQKSLSGMIEAQSVSGIFGDAHPSWTPPFAP